MLPDEVVSKMLSVAQARSQEMPPLLVSMTILRGVVPRSLLVPDVQTSPQLIGALDERR